MRVCQIFTGCILGVLINAAVANAAATQLFVAPDGRTGRSGSRTAPLTLDAALEKVSSELKSKGLPAGGVEIILAGGQYYFRKPYVLGSEFKGKKDAPIVIQAAPGARVQFSGGVQIDAALFGRVTDPGERARLSAGAADNIWAATIKDELLIKKFKEKLMINLSFDGKEYLPSIFPNEGYAKMKVETVTPEVCPPGVPMGKEGYGVRAGQPPHQEPGKKQGWKGTMKEPRGARAGFGLKEDEMGGTWLQWEKELARNNRRNELTGFIEANWLLSSQPIYAASGADRCVHLSRALGYGWGWRKKDKEFRVFGMLCELDAPGEWHFDPLTNRLFVYPPKPFSPRSQISLPVANGFFALKNTEFVRILGLNVSNVGSGTVYNIQGGMRNMVGGCTISSSTATGCAISGNFNGLVGCDLFDLNSHVSLRGGKRSPRELTPGRNLVQNCHFYQKNYKHEKVNISMSGVGNAFRRNLIHNSIGQSMVVNGNSQLIELNEFFNIGFEEGDGGAIYSGADLTGYGNNYRYNFLHHLMHVPGKVARAGIHLDDQQAGSVCTGNIFYKSAHKGIFYNAGAGHVAKDNILLEGDAGIYNVGNGSEKGYKRQLRISSDPKSAHQLGSKEDYVGRAERTVGKNGWARPPWSKEYPRFNLVMSDTGMYGRMWPIRCEIVDNYFYGNKHNKTIFSRVAAEAMAKNIVKNDRAISPSDFVDYDNMNFTLLPSSEPRPEIPFDKIGLYLDRYRSSMPDKNHYRRAIKACYEGMTSWKGTHKQIDTAKVVEEGPKITR